jgi:hypothetical protein
MISFHTFVASMLCAGLFSSLGAAQDLGKYRDFHFGMSLESVAERIQVAVTNAKTTYQRPALIQTLLWDQFGYANVAVRPDSIRSIRFDFYNRQLSKMVVVYDPSGTEGLTPEDLIEALSSIYGAATFREGTVKVSALGVYEENQRILGCWEDAQYSYNLFRSPYGNAFGLVAFSKSLDGLASESSREGDRLDKLEAPAKDIARQMKQEEDKRTAQAKARLTSKPKFRP